LSLLQVDAQDIRAAFGTLEDSGLRPPYKDPDSKSGLVAAWLRQLPKVRPVELKVAIDSHIQDPLRGRHWPLPGQVVAIINRRRPPEVGPIPLFEVSQERLFRLRQSLLRQLLLPPSITCRSRTSP
jgi:hypothetical protein